MSWNISSSKEEDMSIPAYIIDEILKERARRQAPALEELHIPYDMPKEISELEQPAEKPQRSAEELDFFV
jgi:hypothetical protein